jgi:hypothetical protein
MPRHPGPVSVIPDLIRDRDDGPGVHIDRLKGAGDNPVLSGNFSAVSFR